MAFNLGAFAGGLAKGGMDTYTTLKDIERRDQEAAQRAEVHDAWKKEQAGKEGLRQAISEIPTGDSVQVPTYEGMTGGLDSQDIPTRTEAITPDQKMANFRQRAVALGADPTAVQQYEAGGLQIQSARQNLKKGEFELADAARNQQFNKRFDTAMDEVHQASGARLTSIQTTAETGGMKGLVEKFGPELKKALGHDVALVGNNIVVKDGKKVIQTISSLDAAVQALNGVAQLEFGQLLEDKMIKGGLFKTPQEMAAFFKNRSDAAREDRKVGIMESELKAKTPLYAAQANQANAAAGASSAMTRLHNSTLENRETSAALLAKWNELTPEEQAGPKGQAIQREFNMTNVKAGGTVPLGNTGGGGKKNILGMPVEQKANQDGTYTAFAKDGGQALYNTINGEAIPLGMDAQTYQKVKVDARTNGVKLVSGEENGRLVLKFQGADGKFYDDVEKAKYAKPESQAGGATAAPRGALNIGKAVQNKKDSVGFVN